MKNQIRIVPVVSLAALVGAGVLAIFFFTDDAGDVRAFFSQRPTMPSWPTVTPEAPKLPPPPVAVPEVRPAPRPHDEEPPHRPPPDDAQMPAPPPPKPWVRRNPKDCMAMTWRVLGQDKLKVTVGHVPNVTNPYRGDTPCGETRPLLCINTTLPSGAHVLLLPDVRGTALTSRDAGDARCTKKFGSGWRMAEFHDGGGWRLSAIGELPTDAAFWVAINDQHSNPWD